MQDEQLNGWRSVAVAGLETETLSFRSSTSRSNVVRTHGHLTERLLHRGKSISTTSTVYSQALVTTRGGSGGGQRGRCQCKFSPPCGL